MKERGSGLRAPTGLYGRFNHILGVSAIMANEQISQGYLEREDRGKAKNRE